MTSTYEHAWNAVTRGKHDQAYAFKTGTAEWCDRATFCDELVMSLG